MFVAGPLIIASVAQAQTDNVSRAMSDELTRSMSLLQLKQMEKPYFLAYRVQDVTQHEASATLGSLTTSSGDPSHNRVLGVELRVGDYRVLMSIQKDRLIILVVEISHRRNVYK